MTNKEDSEILRCQNCHLPLQLDLSLLDLSLSQRNLVVTSIGDPESADEVVSKEYFPKDRVNKLKNVLNSNEVNDKLKSGHLSEKFIHDNSKLPKEEGVDDELLNHKKSEESQSNCDHQPDLESSKSDPQDINVEKTLSTQISTLSNIFNILSSKSSIDYPVCKDCCQMLIQKLKNEYDETLQEKEIYAQFLDKLEKQNLKQGKVENSDETSKDKTELQNEQIEKQRGELFERLKQLEDEETGLDNELLELTQQLKIKEEQENKLRAKANLEELSQLEFQIDLQNLKNQHESALNNLDLLRKTNIYNETFKISHAGPFGTINGLRLGSFHDVRVSWREINAALGQVVLLLSLLSDQLNFPLQKYKLEPLGSFSKILQHDEENDTWNTLEAYYDENFKFTKLFHRETNFDKSLESLLDITQQLAQNILNSKRNSITTGNDNNINNSLNERLPRNTNQVNPDDTTDSVNNHNTISFINNNNSRNHGNINTLEGLPYNIFRGKINSLSVFLYGKEPDTKWTTAMKFLLTDIKWLLLLSTNNLANSNQ
ncbi:vacuolar protein sorting-associated protein 30 [Monosporozyma unispora]